MRIKTRSHVTTSQFNLNRSTNDEKRLLFDLETDGLLDKVTRIWCCVTYDLDTKEIRTFGPGDVDAALDHLQSADVLAGHNIIGYDLPVLDKLWPGRVFHGDKHLIDTLTLSRVIWPKEVMDQQDWEVYTNVPPRYRGQHGLKAWGYRLSDHKIEFKDFAVYSEEMLQYCIQDVKVNARLFQHILDQGVRDACFRTETDLARCLERQIRSGFPFDIDAAHSLVDELESRKAELEGVLQEAFPPERQVEILIPKVNNAKLGKVKGEPWEKVTHIKFNPGSRKQIHERLNKKYGWEPEAVTEKGNPVVDDEVLGALPYPEAKPMAEYMLVKKRLGQISEGRNAWLKLVTDDGIIHGDVVGNGCVTGRCSHRNPNTAQTPRVGSPYGEECRALWTAPDGFILVGSDAKALELRCLAGFLAVWDDGEYGRNVTDEAIDIHSYNQKMFGVPTRDISKRLLYAVLYGAGFKKAGSIVDPDEKYEIKQMELGKQAIDSFMQGVPALKSLKDLLKQKYSERGYLLGLDGRPLHIRNEYQCLNTLLQSAGAVIMKQVVINLNYNMEKAGYIYGHDWNQHAFIHDEIQMSCYESEVSNVIKLTLQSYREASDYFQFRCPIEGDCSVGRNWRETH